MTPWLATTEDAEAFGRFMQETAVSNAAARFKFRRQELLDASVPLHDRYIVATALLTTNA